MKSILIPLIALILSACLSKPTSLEKEALHQIPEEAQSPPRPSLQAPLDEGKKEPQSAPEEMLVEAEKQRPARPLVPAFPAGKHQKVFKGMGTVFFGFDNAGLSAPTRRQLDKNAAWLRKHPQVMVQLNGHADARGTSEYNLGLGIRRAKKVREYLRQQGISHARMVIVSFGEELPLRRSHNEAAWAKNRRVEFALPKNKNPGPLLSNNTGRPNGPGRSPALTVRLP